MSAESDTRPVLVVVGNGMVGHSFPAECVEHGRGGVVASEDGRKLLGGTLVGDTSDYRMLLTEMRSARVLTGEPAALVLPPLADAAGRTPMGVRSLPDQAQVYRPDIYNAATRMPAIEGYLSENEVPFGSDGIKVATDEFIGGIECGDSQLPHARERERRGVHHGRIRP